MLCCAIFRFGYLISETHQRLAMAYEIHIAFVSYIFALKLAKVQNQILNHKRLQYEFHVAELVSIECFDLFSNYYCATSRCVAHAKPFYDFSALFCHPKRTALTVVSASLQSMFAMCLKSVRHCSDR